MSTSFGVVVRNGLHDVQNESAGADVHGPTGELGLAGRLHAFEVTTIDAQCMEHHMYC